MTLKGSEIISCLTRQALTTHMTCTVAHSNPVNYKTIMSGGGILQLKNILKLGINKF